MKHLALLFALSVTAAQAETILMTCGEVSFRYSDGLLGLGTPTYEQREDAKWVPFCEPYEKPNARAICRPGDKGMVAEYQDVNPNGDWRTVGTRTIDFELLQYLYMIPRTLESETISCKRLNRG